MKLTCRTCGGKCDAAGFLGAPEGLRLAHPEPWEWSNNVHTCPDCLDGRLMVPCEHSVHIAGVDDACSGRRPATEEDLEAAVRGAIEALHNADGDFYLAMMGEGNLEEAQRQVRAALSKVAPFFPETGGER